LSRIAYRDTRYGVMRQALLTPLAGETALGPWRPGATGDLAVMMVEWWAYLGEILTFYNEQIANEAYLRTAVRPDSVAGLVRLLGYRPQPGIAATATLGALLQPGVLATGGITLPAGLQVQSKPGPGEMPQTFELTAPLSVGAPDVVTATPAPSLDPTTVTQLLLAGSVGNVLGNTILLLRPRSGSGPTLLRVGNVTIATLAGGATQTTLSVSTLDSLADSDNLPAGGVAGYRLEKPTASAGLWSLTTNGVSGSAGVHLSGLVRALQPGDFVVFMPTPTTLFSTPILATVSSLKDVVWDQSGDTPTKGSTSTALFPHTLLVTSPAPPSKATSADMTVLYGWAEAGRLIDPPPPNWGIETPNGLAPLPPLVGTGFPDTAGAVLVVGSNGAALTATSGKSNNGTFTLTGATGQPGLASPLTVLFDLLTVTRGKTVAAETLGNGDATVASQSFSLAKSPLTYLRQGAAVVSTLSVTVAGQPWTEVSSFYGQPPDARVFTTLQDTSGVTTVQFGDGVNGARLPPGTGNVIATYRFGSGAAVPAAGALSVLATPFPGLRGVTNPIAATGGADPDPPDQIRNYAPRSVLTFGRAVSVLDFEAIAASVSGGARVGASWRWDSIARRTAIVILVEPQALSIVAPALAAAGDPNRPVTVQAATDHPVEVFLTLRLDPSIDPGTVEDALESAFSNTTTGVFAMQNTGIDQPIYDSQIIAACRSVHGVLAVLDITLYRDDLEPVPPGPVRTPPADGFFTFFNLNINVG
jgi:hypothetical protein